MEFRKSLNKSYNIFGIRIFSIHYHNRFGWFRIFGIGLKYKDLIIHGKTFSERNGYESGLQIGKWYISFLPLN